MSSASSSVQVNVHQNPSVVFAVITLIAYVFLYPLGFLLNVIGLCTGPRRGCFTAMLIVFFGVPLLAFAVIVAAGVHVGVPLIDDMARDIKRETGSAPAPERESWPSYVEEDGARARPRAREPVAETIRGAWSVGDSTGTAAALYRKTLSSGQTDLARRAGWKLAARICVVQGGQPAAGGTWLGYRDGSASYQVQIGSSTMVDAIVDAGSAGRKVLQGTGRAYHLYELEYDARAGRASLSVDGVCHFPDVPAATLDGERYVAFGDGVRDDARRPSRANYALVEFTIGGECVARHVGDRDPTGEGWSYWRLTTDPVVQAVAD